MSETERRADLRHFEDQREALLDDAAADADIGVSIDGHVSESSWNHLPVSVKVNDLTRRINRLTRLISGVIE
jgi:hypothetical protein